MSERSTMQERENCDALEAAFHEFNAKNPVIFNLFHRFAIEARGRGHKHFSADAIMHRVRWETSVSTTGRIFKINNNHIAYYARALMEQRPEFKGFFRTRKVPSD